jgi:dynamin 1-like protein
VDKEKKYFDFEEIRKTIETETDKIAGVNKGVIDDPIRLAGLPFALFSLLL